MPETTYRTMESLLAAVRDCRACQAHLPLGPRPVLRATETARILIVGQAPGLRVHTSGIPWDDPSGERLREWMGMDKDIPAIVEWFDKYLGKSRTAEQNGKQ